MIVDRELRRGEALQVVAGATVPTGDHFQLPIVRVRVTIVTAREAFYPVAGAGLMTLLTGDLPMSAFERVTGQRMVERGIVVLVPSRRAVTVGAASCHAAVVLVDVAIVTTPEGNGAVAVEGGVTAGQRGSGLEAVTVVTGDLAVAAGQRIARPVMAETARRSPGNLGVATVAAAPRELCPVLVQVAGLALQPAVAIPNHHRCDRTPAPVHRRWR